MSVKFEFIMDDADAETLFNIIRAAAAKEQQEATRSMVQGKSTRLTEYFKRDAAYILDLLAGMHNSRIE